MAAKRSIPTTLFASPDFFELSSNTTRLILIGMILDADGEGRGSAHPRLLARKLDQMPARNLSPFIHLSHLKWDWYHWLDLGCYTTF